MKHEMQIVEMIGVVGDRAGQDGTIQTLELNLVKTDSRRPLFDLRWWSGPNPRYGLQLTEQSLAELAELIEHYFSENYDETKTVRPKSRGEA